VSPGLRISSRNTVAFYLGTPSILFGTLIAVWSRVTQQGGVLKGGEVHTCPWTWSGTGESLSVVEGWKSCDGY